MNAPVGALRRLFALSFGTVEGNGGRGKYRKSLRLSKEKRKRKEGKINAPIGRRENDGIKREVMEDGQTAITKYKVLKEGEKFRRSLRLRSFF